MSFSVCIFVICSMSNVGQIQANLRKNAAEMSFVILEMSFGVWEMSFTHFWEMSFTRNAQKKACSVTKTQELCLESNKFDLSRYKCNTKMQI